MKPIKGLFLHLKKNVFLTAPELATALTPHTFKPLTDADLYASGFFSPVQPIEAMADNLAADALPAPLVLTHPDPLFDGLHMISVVIADRNPAHHDVDAALLRRLEERFNAEDPTEISDQEKETLRAEIKYQLGKKIRPRLQRQMGCIDTANQLFYSFSTSEADIKLLRQSLRNALDGFALITPVNEQGHDFGNHLTDLFLGPFERDDVERPATQESLEAKVHIDSVAVDNIALGACAQLKEDKGEKLMITDACNLRDQRYRRHLAENASLAVSRLECDILQGERGNIDSPRRHAVYANVDSQLKVLKADYYGNELSRLNALLDGYESADSLVDELFLQAHLMCLVATNLLPALAHPVMPYVEDY